MYEPKDLAFFVHLTSLCPLAAAELLAQLGIRKGAILQRNCRTAGSSGDAQAASQAISIRDLHGRWI